MFDILRESTVGEILNRVSGGRILPYPDQRPDFVIPKRYLATSSPPSGSAPITRAASSATLAADRNSVASGVTAAGHGGRADVEVEKANRPQSDATLEAGPEPIEGGAEKSPETKGFQVVDWYGEDDPENPRNWSFGKRCFVLAQIVLLT